MEENNSDDKPNFDIPVRLDQTKPLIKRKDKDRKYGRSQSDAVRGFYIMQIASMMVLGKSKTAISKALGIEYEAVKRYSYTDDCRKLIEMITESGQRMASALYGGRAAELMDKALDVLDEMLDKKDPTAAMFVIKMSVDRDKLLPEKQGDTTIQIVMPNSKPDKETVEIKALEESKNEIQD